MEEEKVHIVQAELGKRLLNAGTCGTLTVVVNPHLGGDKQVLTGNTGATDTLTHGRLIEVGLGGIDVAVSGGDSVSDGLRGRICRNLEDTEPYCRNRSSVR